MAQAGRVRIRVTDPTGAVIPDARVSLLGRDDMPARTEQTDELGEIVFADLPLGDLRIEVVKLGFATRRLTVTLRNGEELNVDAALKVGLVGGFVTVTMPVPFPDLPTTPVVPPYRSLDVQGRDSRKYMPQQPATAPAFPATKPAKKRRWWIFR